MSAARKGRPLKRGDVVVAAFPEHAPPGHEQEGERPAVVVALPGRTGQQRFRMIVLVPFTSKLGAWAQKNPTLYPICKAGQGGLSRDSAALIDHVRGVDDTRIVKYIGTLQANEYEPVAQGLEAIFSA